MTSWVRTITHWPLSMNVLAVFALSVIVPWLAVAIIRRFWPDRQGNNELVGFTYAVYGLIYGVLLAFTIVVTWERFADTEKLVMSEATILSELWRDSLAFPPAIHDPLQRDLNAYAQSVVDDEWPEMAAHGRAHYQTEEIYSRLWDRTYHIEPKTKNQEVYMGQLLSSMNELSGVRRLRILHSRMEVHSVLWLVLLIGAVPTIAYTLLFSARHAWVQVVITGTVMLIVLLCLLLTLTLQHPFVGDVGIKPTAFQDLLESFRLRMLMESGRLGP